MDTESDVIKLDVGGSLYTTLRSTLTSYPDSMLGAMFSGRIPVARDELGRYVVDGDGPTFRYVLNFLRRSKLNLPEGFKEWDLLTTEADFYQIKELIDAVASLREDRKAERGCKIQRTEFIEIGDCPNKYYYYLGHADTLKQIPSLFKLSQHQVQVSRFFPLEGPAVENGRIRLDYNYCCQGGGDSFESKRMQIFQEIALLGFELVYASHPWLFKRNIMF